MKVIIINGYASTGKDAFIEACAENEDLDIYNISTIDYVKGYAELAGWDGVKDDRGRAFLSDLKDAMTKYDDIPVRKIKETIETILLPYNNYKESTDGVIIFIHCREPEEIERLRADLNAQTLLVRRPEAEEQQFSNHADQEVFNYDYDYTYWNVYDLETLKEDALNFINFIAKQDWHSGNEEIKAWDDEKGEK